MATESAQAQLEEVSSRLGLSVKINHIVDEGRESWQLVATRTVSGNSFIINDYDLHNAVVRLERMALDNPDD